MAELKGKIIFTCGREVEYPRNSLILSLFQNKYETHAITSSSRILLVRYASLALRFLYWRLAWLINPKSKPSLVYIGFLGQPLVPFTRLFWRGPILFDAFLSLYDTLCFDRKKVSPNGPIGRLAFWLDRLSCSLANRVILDTEAHARYFNETFRIPREKISVLHVGCQDHIFTPRPGVVQENTVLFYGSFLPLHGIDVIIHAAALLKDTDIQFKIIGDGIEKKRILALMRQLKTENVTLCPPVPLWQLPDEIAQSAVCLGGHFGVSDKAARVIAGKTFQCIAMGKPTILGDNPANRELLTHGKDAWFCQMGSPQALAEAVQTLMDSPQLRQSLSEQARTTFLARSSQAVLEIQLRTIVDQMVA